MDIKRINNYNKNHCWQYEIRLNNLNEDIKNTNLPINEINNLKISDFNFKIVVDKDKQKEMKTFIEKHEWLGNLSQYTTHWFGAYYKNILSGVILFNVPNAFSKLLGENTKNLERLISRGACISWSPKNLASALLMFSIKYMVKNTQYRLFSAYADPTAKELGTIYQACNFYYLGKKYGTTKRYINPYTGKLVSDRYFRQKTAYKKYAQELGIKWEKNWQYKTGINWDNIPDDIEKQLRYFAKNKQKTSDSFDFPSKHKYVYVLGKNKTETKQLRKLFLKRNKIYKYPKNRINQ